MSILILIISLLALLWSANHLVTGASGLAIRLKISPFIIGLTLVALGTSLPELFVTVVAFFKNKNTISLANTVGANIANLGLVLGATIFLKPIALNYLKLKKTYPVIIILMLFVYTLILEGFLGSLDGSLFLILCLTGIAIFVYLGAADRKQDVFFNEFKIAVISGRSISTNLLSVIIGLLILPISLKYLVHHFILIAKWLSISNLTISLTLLPICATLAPLVTALTAALKNEEDIAVGTILGSNICYLFIVIIFPSIIGPTKTSCAILWRDMPMMFALLLLLFFLSYHYQKRLSAWHGSILVIVYCSYIVSLIIKVHS